MTREPDVISPAALDEVLQDAEASYLAKLDGVTLGDLR
jgi:hypothetical protein